MIYNDIIFQASKFYIPRGFRYRTYPPKREDQIDGWTTIHNYYDGKMSINISSDDSNVAFIIRMDGVYINEKAGDYARKFYINMQALHLSSNIDVPSFIEDEINENGTRDMIAHYKGMIRNSKLLEIGI